MGKVIVMGSHGWCNRCGSEMHVDDQGRSYCSDQDASTCTPPQPGATRNGKPVLPYRR